MTTRKPKNLPDVREAPFYINGDTSTRNLLDQVHSWYVAEHKQLCKNRYNNYSDTVKQNLTSHALRASAIVYQRRVTAKIKTYNYEIADDFNDKHFDMVKDLRDRGLSLQQIADYLNQQGKSTRRGFEWRASAVLRLLHGEPAKRRLAKLNPGSQA